MSAAALLSLWPVLSRAGWPTSHESWVWVTRLGVVRAAWQRGDLFPLWWREGNRGLGSPMPALYHKLQNYVCALLLEVFGDVKLAQTLSLLFFTLIGCVGMRKLARQLGASPWTATVHALMLPFASYVTTVWLVRGAYAEHAALMLLPWLLVGLLDLIEYGRVRTLLLAGTLTLLFYAHSVTALFSVALIAIAALLALARHPRRSVHILGRGSLAAVCFGLAIAPALLVMNILAKQFYMEHVTSGYYNVHRHLTNLYNAWCLGQYPIIDFFAAPDQELRWAVPVAALLALPRYFRAPGARRWADPALAFLVAGGALMMFLRLESAGPIYDLVPGLRYIQFPWRLLSIITLVLIALSAALLGRIQPRLAVPLATLCLALMVVRSRVFYVDDVRRHPPEELAQALQPSTHVRWWEYLPKSPVPVADWELSVLAQGPVPLTGGCTVRVEGCVSCFVVECSSPGTIALPYAFSSLELVTDGAGRKVPVFREYDDPRVLVEVHPGRTLLRYRKPSWLNLGRRLLAP